MLASDFTTNKQKQKKAVFVLNDTVMYHSHRTLNETIIHLRQGIRKRSATTI